MGFRQIYVQEAERLSTSDNCLVVFKGDEKGNLTFPLEDIDLIFLEDPNTMISSRLLSALSQHSVSLILCGPDYLPCSQTIPFNGHYKQTQMLNLQIALLPSKKNKLWEMIIRQKITNQLAVIEHTSNDEDTYLKMRNFLSEVKSGDERNMEGLAAREYFKSLFGMDFLRFSDSPVSLALNYGYSILTGAVVRSVAFSGLNGNLGIWHQNVQNANNLSCDLVEPFRQVVDYYVYEHLSEIQVPLQKETRHDLVNLLNSQVFVDGRQYQVSYAISLVMDDFVQFLSSGNASLVKLPSLSFK